MTHKDPFIGLCKSLKTKLKESTHQHQGGKYIVIADEIRKIKAAFYGLN